MNEERHLDINQARLIGRCSWCPEGTLADGDTKAWNNPMLSTLSHREIPTQRYLWRPKIPSSSDATTNSSNFLVP
jgi:hypothetical protein